MNKRKIIDIYPKINSFVNGLKNFILPRVVGKSNESWTNFSKVWVVIASYKTPAITVELVNALYEYNPGLHVLLVDDSTPEGFTTNLDQLRDLSKNYPWFKLIRTETNQLRAGAMNYAFDYLSKQNVEPDVVIVMDDDVKIAQDTIIELVKALNQNPEYGAVCSQAHIINKNQNILTRLQGLEYHSFNISRMMDEGFFTGPLVMHGMLSAYRFKAIKEVGGYTVKHLIEDYDYTAKLKKKGWKVGYAAKSIAWTDAPYKFSQLWKQRVRWNYGGLYVLKDNIRTPINILQDIIGHSTFLITVALILLSYILKRYNLASGDIIFTLIIVALSNFLVSIGFSIYILRFYSEVDYLDILLRVTVLPEFFYANLLSVVQFGSYIYFVHNNWVKHLLKKLPFGPILTSRLDLFFSSIGFSDTWGTR